MKLHLRVLTGKKEFLLKWNNEEKILYVMTKSIPQKGKANDEILKKLKKFFKSEVSIIAGLKSKEKVVEIDLAEEEILKKLSNTN